MDEGQIGALVKNIRINGHHKESEEGLHIIHGILHHSTIFINDILEGEKVMVFIIYRFE